MQWTVPEILSSERMLVTLAVAGVVIGIVQLSKRPNLNAFPTVGSTSYLGSWRDGISFAANAADTIREGYRKHKGTPFKIATLYRWVVVVSSRAHIEELRNAPNDELLFLEPAFEDINAEFMMGSETVRAPYHITVIRSRVTRNLGVLFPQLQDEVITTFDRILDLKGNEWKSVPAFTTVRQVVCMASSRVFVGLPLCRDPDFVALNIQYAVDFFLAGSITVGFLPKILKVLVGHFLTNIPNHVRRGVGHLRPVIEERRKHLNQYGSDWTEKPNDFLSWLMDEGGPDATVESLTRYLLSTNIALIHSTSNAFTHVLYNLAANPQYAQPLREEVEGIVEKEGWSKASLSKMRRVDSFLKETIRMENPGVFGLRRKANKDFMFSDGTLIPKGTRLHAPLVAIHYDETLYENPEVFDPFRFADMSEKHQFSATSSEYLSFGYGRHACPGRFFASFELKTMLAHVVTTYDVKLEGNSARPQNLHAGATSRANPTAKVMFRKRTHQDEKH